MSILCRTPFLFDAFDFDDVYSPIVPTDSGFLLEIPVPGMTQENIQLHLENQSIYVSGETNKTHKQSKLVSKFSYVYPLPKEADLDSLEATVKNGVLTVEMKKNKMASKRKDIKWK